MNLITKRKPIVFIRFIILLFYSSLNAQINEIITISEDLEIKQISDNVYIHISYFDLRIAPHFPANGVVYADSGKVLVIDTPWRIKESQLLINWIKESLNAEIVGIVPTHHHRDCMGGLEAFHQAGVRSYAAQLTAKLAEKKKLTVPQITFQDSLRIKLNEKDVICHFFGGGHSLDNIIVWFPEEKLLFGGCAVKALNWRGLGNLTDADVYQWPNTLKKVISIYPGANIVIPGHGDFGDMELIHHTLQLLKNHKKGKENVE
jgi:metallo-beta-lactamase class B